MKGGIISWDPDRGVGMLRPDRSGPTGDLFVTTALFVESGLGQPRAGDRYGFGVRLPPGCARIEPFGFHRLLAQPVTPLNAESIE
jgi:hypothetical protein